MARITLRQLLDHAAEHDYGVPAFNINNMEQALAIMDAASTLDAPVIIQASRGARSYANDVMLRHMMDAVTEIYPQIPVCVHLDHGNEPATCMTAIQAGFTSVMMDGSLKPTWGVPRSEIQRGIKHGVRKINIDTDNRMAMTGQIRKVLNSNPEEFDPRKYLKPAMEAMAKLCKQRLAEFNAAGQASKIKKVLTTAEMAKRYGKGELDPKVA